MPPRWPSWKIHTSAPNVAVSDKPLSSNVFSGNTTLPVSRNISTKVIAAMTVRTMGNRERDGVGGVAVDRCGPGQKRVPACRTGHGLQPVELRLGGLRVQRRAARDGQKCAAVADRGRGRGRSDKR